MDRKLERSFSQKYFKKLSVVAISFSVVIAAYGFSCSTDTGRSQNVSTQNLTISEVKQGAFIDALSLRGQVVPKTSIYLDTIAGGLVEERLVEQGEFVEKGQPLVRLSNTNLQLDVMS